MMTAEHEEFRQMVRRFVKDEITPHVDKWEQAKMFPAHELFPKLGALGMIGPSYDPAYGGAGGDYGFHVILADEMGRCGCMGVPMAIMVQGDISTSAMSEYAGEKLKQAFLAPAIAGTMVGALGVTEPDTGSDVASLTTRAESDGDHYVINGSKMWITNGVQADFVTTLCRTSDEGGYRGMSLIVVPTKTPGFSVGKKLEKMGNHSSDTGLLVYDNVRVPKWHCIGQEGKGFYYQMQEFQKERLVGSMLGVSMGDECVRRTVAYCRDRNVFGQKLIEKQWVYFHLAELRTELTILRQFVYHCTERFVAGDDITKEISMAKLKAGRLVRQVTDLCVQFHGGMGYAEEYPLARFYRDARLLSIGAGADEVMLEVIAKLEGFGPA
jgi:citronellyl-CoA dehydrogenase